VQQIHCSTLLNKKNRTLDMFHQPAVVISPIRTSHAYFRTSQQTFYAPASTSMSGCKTSSTPPAPTGSPRPSLGTPKYGSVGDLAPRPRTNAPTKCLIPCKSEHGLTTHRTNPVSDHRVSYGRCHELVQMFRGLLDYLRRGVALDCQDAKHVSHCFVFIVHGLA
jgi:hypothetical protein